MKLKWIAIDKSSGQPVVKRKVCVFVALNLQKFVKCMSNPIGSYMTCLSTVSISSSSTTCSCKLCLCNHDGGKLAMQASEITDGVQQILQNIAAGKSEVSHSTQLCLCESVLIQHMLLRPIHSLIISLCMLVMRCLQTTWGLSQSTNNV